MMSLKLRTNTTLEPSGEICGSEAVSRSNMSISRKNFSGGADVAIFKGKTANEARERFTSHLRTIADLEELPFPTIAAVQRACIAAGLELALACDLIWAASSARFGQVEASIGTTTLLGGVQRLAAVLRASPKPRAA